MLQYLLFILLLPAVTLAEPRIIGGHRVSIKDYPYQLSLRRSGVHICGGAILSPKIAISAAHCFQTNSPYSVKAGITNLKEPGVISHVKLALIHPNYKKSRNDYDIALLFLSSSLPFSDSIKSVALPTPEDKVRKGLIGIVSGWGVTSHNSREPYTMELRALEMPVWGFTRCNQAYFNSVTERMFCAGFPQGGRDSCSGDSGGPFVANGVLYGVVSAGMDCAQPGFPGIYTNVVALRKFISDNTGL